MRVSKKIIIKKEFKKKNIIFDIVFTIFFWRVFRKQLKEFILKIHVILEMK
jgi:hypothetical protein